MTFIKRLFLVFPIAIFAFLHYWVYNPDDRAFGLVHLFLKVFFIFFFFVAITTTWFSLFATTPTKRVELEFILYFIVVGSLLSTFYTFTFRGHTNGDIWIQAASSESPDHQTLTLRKNGNFTFSNNEVDFATEYSGTYIKKSDSIFLEEEITEKGGNKVSDLYILKDSFLFPVYDTSNKSLFKVKERH